MYGILLAGTAHLGFYYIGWELRSSTFRQGNGQREGMVLSWLVRSRYGGMVLSGMIPVRGNNLIKVPVRAGQERVRLEKSGRESIE